MTRIGVSGVNVYSYGQTKHLSEFSSCNGPRHSFSLRISVHLPEPCKAMSRYKTTIQGVQARVNVRRRIRTYLAARMNLETLDKVLMSVRDLILRSVGPPWQTKVVVLVSSSVVSCSKLGSKRIEVVEVVVLPIKIQT